MKELVWCEGSLYSGDDAGVICKVERGRGEGSPCDLCVTVGLYAQHVLDHECLQ